jgi:hypothetical protein
MIAKLLIALMLTSILGIAANSQTANEVRIDPKQPSLYFTPERIESDKLWLRLHNNSRWAISFRTARPPEITVPFSLADGSVVKTMIDGTEVSPEYLIENPTTGGYGEFLGCVHFESWLTPGNSALMSVDLEKLKPLAYLSVKFRYEWSGNRDDLEHRVFFKYYPETKLPTGQ